MAKRVCWYCGHSSHMTRVTDTPKLDMTDSGLWRQQAAFACDECLTFSIGVSFSAQVKSHSDFDVADLAWMPKRVEGQDYPDVPSEIADAASEACRCFSIDAYRGAAALARSVVEATAKAKQISNGQLYDKIEAMHSADLIRGHIKEAAHEIRHLGNEVAHGDFVEPVTREEAEEVLVLMGEVLEEVFQSPARVARRREARESKATTSE